MAASPIAACLFSVYLLYFRRWAFRLPRLSSFAGFVEFHLTKEAVEFTLLAKAASAEAAPDASGRPSISFPSISPYCPAWTTLSAVARIASATFYDPDMPSSFGDVRQMYL